MLIPSRVGWCLIVFGGLLLTQRGLFVEWRTAGGVVSRRQGRWRSKYAASARSCDDVCKTHRTYGPTELKRIFSLGFGDHLANRSIVSQQGGVLELYIIDQYGVRCNDWI